MAVGRTNSIGLNTAEATATANDILYGKTAFAGNTIVTGTIVTKTSNDLTASGATVTVPAGYYASQATKSVTTTTHPNPTASVNSSTGVVTASHTQTAGYVSAGTTTGTLQLTVQAAATITPGTSNKTAVAAGRYTTGAVTVAGDADLTAANIKNGVNIFGVAGTFTYATAASAAGAGHILKDKVAFVNGAQVTGTIVTKTASDLTASGAVVTVPAGYYASQATKSVGTGSAKPPASISGSSATVSTGSNTLTLSKTISVTPTVTAGYVSAGTAGNVSVSLTGSVTTKAAATITPGTSNQTIAAGTYLTGAQTIAGNANLVAANIKKDVSIFGVTGSYVGGGSNNIQSYLITRHQYTPIQIVTTAGASKQINLATPLTFSDYPNGIVFEVDVNGLASSASSLVHFYVLAKNSSNAVVTIDASFLSSRVVSDPANAAVGNFLPIEYYIGINSDGTGIGVINTINTEETDSRAITSSAITQITGLKLTVSRADTYTMGIAVTAFGLK